MIRLKYGEQVVDLPIFNESRRCIGFISGKVLAYKTEKNVRYAMIETTSEERLSVIV